jgi:hypothetical protein
VPTKLPVYLETIDLLTVNIGLTDSDKIQVAIRYADRDDAELWETSSQVQRPQPDWLAFVTEVQRWYPGCDGNDSFYVPEPATSHSTYTMPNILPNVMSADLPPLALFNEFCTPCPDLPQDTEFTSSSDITYPISQEDAFSNILFKFFDATLPFSIVLDESNTLYIAW